MQANWVTSHSKQPFYLRRAFSLERLPASAELSVCGSGDLEFAQLSWFEMTTITFERHELGRKAAQLMLKMLRKEEPEPENILSPTRLVIRKSTVSPLNRNS